MKEQRKPLTPDELVQVCDQNWFIANDCCQECGEFGYNPQNSPVCIDCMYEAAMDKFND